MNETQESSFAVGDRVHMSIDGAWVYGTVADILWDSSVVVVGYMSNWAKRAFPDEIRKVCAKCALCKELNERPPCAY